MRIVIADDHMIFREGLKLLLARRADWQVVGETGELSGLRRLIGELQPDLLLMDYNMPGGDAAASLSYLRQRHPGLRILVLTAERTGTVLQQLLAAGADGVLLKEGSADSLLAAMGDVAAGRRVVPDAVRNCVESTAVSLTPRELQVLHLLCLGWSHAAIATQFSLSPRTVDKHRENLQRKLGVSHPVQLLHKARSLGLIGELPG